MTKSLPILLLVFIATSLSAQITLTSDYFPMVNDTLKMTRADSSYAASVDLIIEGGADLDWYLGMPVGSSDFDRPVNAVTDDAFPTADVSILGSNGITETFFQISANSFDIVGVRTTLEILPNFPVEQALEPSRPSRRAPLNYEDSFSTVTENFTIISPDSLPEELLAELPATITAVDSIKITTISTRNDIVDAYGTVRLGDNFYSVLREKRTEVIDIRLAVKSAPFDFIDITGTVTILNPQLAAFLGPQAATIQYLFWSDESVEPILDVNTDAGTGNVFRMEYKRAQTSTSTEGPAISQAQVTVFPNPATDLATFEVEGLVQGDYTLQVIDMAGRKVASRKFSPVGDQTRLTIDVSDLRSGIYLYSVRNERGRIIVTKRLKVR
jgi:hypothetical protein